MINTNSPIVQSIMSGGNGMHQPNTLNMGYGYNSYPNPYQMAERNIQTDPFMASSFGQMGGYYNPYASQLGFNPYNPYAQLHARQQQAMLREQQRKELDFMKKISRNVHKALGDMNDEQIEEHVNTRYVLMEDKIANETEEQRAERKALELMERMSRAIPAEAVGQMYVQRHNKLFEDRQSKMSNIDGVVSYFDNLGAMILEDRLEQQFRKQKDLSRLYSSDTYKNIIEQNKSGGYFNSVFGGHKNKPVTLDDMEIMFPQALREKELIERRAAFIASIGNSRKSSMYLDK